MMDEATREKGRREHREKYDALCKKHCIYWSENQTHMGRTPEQWVRLYDEDCHLNNVPLREWGIESVHLGNHYGLSIADGVCIVKNACIQMVERVKAMVGIDELDS